jgi:NADP-dependent 3-hydroxy acid dehydrogenase YdfG
MQRLDGQVAVITGAASGIGLALARHAQSLGCKLVLADVDAITLKQIAREFAGTETACMTQVVDVSDAQQVDALAQASYEQFGRVDLLFNNAGIMINGLSWQLSSAQWQQVLSVNLMGVVHGITSFVPRMIAQNAPAHIVNTSSLAGLLAAPLMGPYGASKHAIVAISETLHYELQSIGACVGVSVLCPAQVATNIMQAADAAAINDVATDRLNQFLRSGISGGMTPAFVAAQVFEAVAQKKFWIFTHPGFKPAYTQKCEALVAERNPQFQQVVCD